MKEHDLISLGFERVDVSAEDSGDEAFYYFTLDLTRSGLSLISCDDADAKEHGWFVELFDYEGVRFESYQDLITFIQLIKKCTIA